MDGDGTIRRIHALAAITAVTMLAAVWLSAGAENGTGEGGGASLPVSVVINEVMADNGALLRAPDGTYPDWVELHNTGEYTVNLTGMYLGDNLENATWRFPNGTVIAAGGYLLVWADGNPSQGALHADFRLRANGEAVALFASDGETLVDSIAYGKQIEDVSYGRLPDGSPGWSYMTTPTPEAANVENVRAFTSTPWPLWPLLAVGITASVAVILRDRMRRRQK